MDAGTGWFIKRHSVLDFGDFGDFAELLFSVQGFLMR